MIFGFGGDFLERHLHMSYVISRDFNDAKTILKKSKAGDFTLLILKRAAELW